MIPSSRRPLAALIALLASGKVLAGAMPLLGTTVYMSRLGLLGYKYLYLPAVLIVVLLVYWLALRQLPRRWLRWGLAVLLAAGLAILPWWDVYQTGKQVTGWCRKEGGLHVYKTVEAEGFEGSTSIEYWSKYGFRYVDGYGKRFMLVDGKREALTLPSEGASRYVWGSKEDHHPLTPLISRSSSHVIDRRTGEELGTLVWFTIDPGWWDRLLLGLVPGELNPWICGEEVPGDLQDTWGKKYDRGDLILGTLRPQALDGGD